MSEFSEDLRDQLNKMLYGKIISDKEVNKLKGVIKNSTTYEDAYSYAMRYGEILADSIQALDIETWLFGTAMQTWEPSFKALVSDVNEVCETIQANKNAIEHIGLKPQTVPYDNFDMREVVNSLTKSPDTKTNIQEFLKNVVEESNNKYTSAITNYANKHVDKTQRKNMELLMKSGMTVRVTRIYDKVGLHTNAKRTPCLWCLERSGTKQFKNAKEAADSGIFARHEGCGCKIDYDNRKTGTRTVSRTKNAATTETNVINKKEIDNKQRTIDALGQSYDYHRIHNGLYAVEYKDIKDDGVIDVNFGKIDSRLEKNYSDTIISLSEKYDTTLHRIRPLSKEEFLTKKDAFAFVFHNYSVDDSTMVINPSKFKNYEEHITKLTNAIKSGYAAKVPLEYADRYIATHEFAHTLIDTGAELNNKRNFLKADYKEIQERRKAINDVYDKYMAEVEKATKIQKSAEFQALTSMSESDWEKAREASRNLEKIKISKYSLESADEFFAECFALTEYTTTDNIYANEIRKLINEKFRR